MQIIAVKNGEASIWETSIKSAAEDEGFDCRKGMNALDYLQDICGFTIIEVPDLETTEEIATAYHGKAKYAVQDAAWKILRLGGKYADAKRRQIDSLCKSGALAFCLVGNQMTVTFSEDGFDYQTSFEKEDGEWEVSIFNGDEALKMLGIADDDDMISYLIDCIGVENEKNN